MTTQETEQQQGPGRGQPSKPHVIGSRRNLQRLSPIAWGFLAIALILGLIEALSMVFPPFLMPDVLRIFSTTAGIVAENGSDLLESLRRFLQAMSVALVAGWVLGILMASQRQIGNLFEPVLKVVMATPGLSWILLAVIWFRSIEIRVAFVVVLLVFPFYAVSVFEAIKGMGNELLAAIQQFRPNRRQLLSLLLLPFSVAVVIATTKSVSGFAMRILIFAEVLAASAGVGWLMGRAQSNFQVDEIFALTVIAVIFNFLFLWAVRAVERYVLRWRPETELR